MPIAIDTTPWSALDDAAPIAPYSFIKKNDITKTINGKNRLKLYRAAVFEWAFNNVTITPAGKPIAKPDMMILK